MKAVIYIILFVVVGIIILAFYNELTMSYPNLKFYQDQDVIRVKKSNIHQVSKNDILFSCDSIRYLNTYDFDEHIEKYPVNSVHMYKFISASNGEDYSILIRHHRLTKNNIVVLLLSVSIFFLIMAYIIVSIGPNELYSYFLFMFFISISVTAVTFRVCFYNVVLYSIFIISTSFVPGCYLSFLSVFPKKFNNTSKVVYISSLSLSAFLAFLWLKSYFDFLNYKTAINYINLFGRGKISQVYVMIAIISGIVVICVEYYYASSVDKKRLKWLILGQTIGFAPFLFSFSFSFLLFRHEWINLAYVLLFSVAVPITFLLGVFKFKLGYINSILARIIIVLIYLTIGIALWFICNMFFGSIHPIILKRIILSIFIVLYLMLVYFTYSIILDRILRLFFREYYRKITLVSRYIKLLTSSGRTKDVLPEILKQIEKIFNLEYIRIERYAKNCGSEYYIKLTPQKIACFRKNNNDAISIDEMFILRSFLNSLNSNNLIK